MKKLLFLWFVFTGTITWGQQISSLKILSSRYYDDLPSASGVEIYKGNVYLVADDLPRMFELDMRGQILHQYQISGNTKIVNGRTPKNIKADFESMAIVKQNNHDYLLVLSSGSKKIKRDTAYLFSLENKRVVAKKNIRGWYNAIKKKAAMAVADEINIEGLAIARGKIYVAHRGNVSGNFIASSSLTDFISYLSGESNVVPAVDIFPFKLPLYNGLTAGLSGLCSTSDDSGLLVTASLESTDDVVNDGSVLGSYLGYIPFKTMEKGVIFLTPVVGDNHKMIAKKQEGITLVNVTKKGRYRVLTVCDNDDGTSDMWQFSFVLSEGK